MADEFSVVESEAKASRKRKLQIPEGFFFCLLFFVFFFAFGYLVLEWKWTDETWEFVTTAHNIFGQLWATFVKDEKMYLFEKFYLLDKSKLFSCKFLWCLKHRFGWRPLHELQDADKSNPLMHRFSQRFVTAFSKQDKDNILTCATVHFVERHFFPLVREMTKLYRRRRCL